MFASADYFALCDMKTVWLNYNFIWNTMAEFHRILRRFLPLSLSSIVLYDIIMFVHDPFFSTFQCGTAAYIHSVACSHVRIISFTNLKWKGNGNGFGLFSALFIIIRTNSRIQSITIMFTDFCTASIHFKTFWYLVKWFTFTIATCSAQEPTLLLRSHISQTIAQRPMDERAHEQKIPNCL